MYTNVDKFEEFEMHLASEFGTGFQVPTHPSYDTSDMGYKILDALACDLALDAGVLDFDELN